MCLSRSKQIFRRRSAKASCTWASRVAAFDEGNPYMVCAHVLAMHISENGLGVVPMHYSTVRVVPRAGVGWPQSGADQQYGTQSCPSSLT
jgi:hypothetical protein